MLTVRAARDWYFQGHSIDIVRDWARAGHFGPCIRAPKGYLIPEDGIIAWQKRNTIQFGAGLPRPDGYPAQVSNLIQFRK